ncbi:MAG: M16 family metallopeptidase [Alphaproteobacteria bacterium]
MRLSRLATRYSRRIILGLIAACTVAGLQLAIGTPFLYGQEAASKSVGSKVERKNRAPISREILRVTIPKPVATRLQNGVRALILEDHRFPTVSVQLHIAGAGALFEPPDLPGLADVTAQMLREGTKGRTSKQLAEEIEGLGATLGAGSGFGSTDAVLSASGLSENFDAWFGLTLDVLLNPTFPAEELAKLKQRLQAQLRQQRAAPNFLVRERFNRAVFGSHPAAVIAATPQSIDLFTPEILARWHREHYAPQNAILAIAGDVRAPQLIPKLEKWFARWQQNGFKPNLPSNPVPAQAKKVFLVDRPESVQTAIALGNIAIDRRSTDYMPMLVLNYILGGGPAARLFLNLREEKGYTYGVYSNFTAVEYPGPWSAGGSMRTEVTGNALTEFFNEIRRIRDEEVTEAELTAAQRAITAGFALSLEQPSRILNFAVTREIYRLPDDYWESYPAKIMMVTAEDVQRVARKYLDPDTMQLVAVGDGRKIRAALEKYGPVEVYDSSGNPAPVSRDAP